MRTRKKRWCSVLSMLSLVCITIPAQTIYVHVEQEGKPLEQLGTAKFDVSTDSQPCVEFVDGKAVMTINGNRVASLPMSSDGTLVIEHQISETVTNINKVTKSPSEQHPYVTLYSPFQLKVPRGCEAFVPEYDPNKDVLLLNASTQARPGAIVPPETALVVSGTETVDFEITAQLPTCTLQSGLTGSSLKIHPRKRADDIHLRHRQERHLQGPVRILPLHGHYAQSRTVLLGVQFSSNLRQGRPAQPHHHNGHSPDTTQRLPHTTRQVYRERQSDDKKGQQEILH